MGVSSANTHNPFRYNSPAMERDEWEDWDEEERPGTKPLDLDDDKAGHDGQRDSLQRYSVQRPVFRAKSKGHTKAKIAKAGITLDTNVSKSRQTPKLQRKSMEQSARPENAGRFADAAALRALEGSPNSASVGSFSWLKRKPGNLSGKSVKNSPLSPESRPIVIGIAMPSDTASEHQVSPRTAVVETPFAVQQYNQRLASQRTGGSAATPVQLRSVWSPDTEASESPYVPRPASSVYSHMTIRGGGGDDFSNAPPVPTLPATYKFKQTQQLALADLDDDDLGTPCTLFEEDGSPLASRKSIKPASAISPEGTGRSKGWWDTVRISQQTNNPFRQTPQQTGESSSSAATPKDWWHESNKNEKQQPLPQSNLMVMTAAIPQHTTGQSSRSIASSSQQTPTTGTETQSEKARILLEENQNQTQSPIDQPPPYSLNEVKYGAILPPSHVVSSQPIPSPGPMSPGLSRTMTSQGAIMMSDVPLTPRNVPRAVLPDRPVGTFVSHDQFRDAPGTNFRVERNRRRHEKEDFVARKVGGFWRGRGCVPTDGCFGRTGREGRKRRRVCLGIFGGILAAIILIVVLAVVLTRQSITQSHDVSQNPVQAPEQTPEQTPVNTVWLNLTDFPPMPTGVLTVSGPDNSEAFNGCLKESAATLWSCSIPKDQQKTDALYGADRPEFIFQIQFDNNTRALWNVTDAGEQPSQGGQSIDQPKEHARGAFSSAVARAAAFIQRAIVYDTGFSPNPAPPDQADMFFLGNTTDGIVSDRKAGEPTPFFISLLASIDGTVGPNVLDKRGLGNGIDTAPENGTSASQNISHFVDPPITSDKTPLPATLYPLPSQQPVRLYDRGLSTEHYGFYTYFNKSIFIFDQEKDNDADAEGGALLKNATTLVVWSQARFLVKIWTRLDSKLIGNGTVPGTDGSTVNAQPGTMPYPVTIIEDFHGGDENTKGTIVWNIGDDQRVDTSNAKLVTVDKGAVGTLINPLSDADRSLGGIDGGTGGCRCAWVNFRDTS
ncbi:glycoprotease family protein [Seiridium cupressi]